MFRRIRINAYKHVLTVLGKRESVCLPRIHEFIGA